MSYTVTLRETDKKKVYVDPGIREGIYLYSGERPAVIADAGDLAGDLVHGKAVSLLRRPRGQRHTGHHAAENTQQKINFIRPPEILPNALQESTFLSCLAGQLRAPAATPF